ncbi:MAG: efflux RND transporter periplasmic adaptor subunit [Burkholderiaceae bacterium]
MHRSVSLAQLGRALSASTLLCLLLASCSRPVEKVEEIRPVRAMVVAAGTGKTIIELAGEIQPRYESQLGFRVGGKLIARKVEVGTLVKRGQVLMQLDPLDLQLAQSQAKAAVSATESTLALAKADLDRYRELRQKNFVSQALLDAKEAAYKSAIASHEQANAGLKVQANQSSYSTLYADADGVITAVQAEVGQVVAAGTPVVKLARTGEKEVRVSIPEDQIEVLRQVTDLAVKTWANSNVAISGRLRELSPIADPATRTYTAKISLPRAGPEIRLGMTATVQFAAPALPGIHLPMTALVNSKEGTAVWVVENGVVKLVPVQVASATGTEVLVAQGLSAGQSVVTAGVNQLRPGQKVSLLGQELSAINEDTKPAAAGAPK